MPHGVPLWPLLLCFHLASTQVIANTRQLVSLLSEQFLTIKGNFSGLLDPQLLRYRLASAAAARHAARHAAAELDVAFCEAAPRMLETKTEWKSIDQFDFATHCCDPAKFDSLGHEKCFPEWPSWPVRICCAHHLSKPSYFKAAWKVLALSIFDDEVLEEDRPRPPVQNQVKGIMAYHKSGVTLSTELVGNVVPGPLTRLLLKDPEEKVMVPHDFHVTKFGDHNSPRGGRPVITPFFQAFTRTFSDLYTQDMIIHFSNPLKSREPQFQDFMRQGAGKLLHLVRRPSDMILSGYIYHRQNLTTGEEWLRFRNPPDCLSCDHEAWSDIFRLCGFRCSYSELLQNLTSQQGLQVEQLRSRWDILKMLENAHAWRDLDHVLQVPMESFRQDFNGTLLCIARFFFSRPVEDESADAPPEFRQFLEESQLHSPSFIESCRETLQRGGRCAAAPPGEDEAKFVYRATTHVAAKLEKKRLHAELRRTPGWRHFLPFADAALEATLQGSPTRRIFGCPG
ncbi:Uncharacterized protein SCF082_LOCUS21667 [Durusdinium trenchii]|uniref:Sulfotransferase n=1 Tax=Durusdinium trenchii TaxID=1381693 RepID=A0ABP0LAW7_9DINO